MASDDGQTALKAPPTASTVEEGTSSKAATWSLDGIPLPEVLLSLYCESVTGLYTAGDGESTYRVWLNDGAIVTASTTGPSKRLGEYLIDEGLIEKEKLEAALADGDGTPLGQQLVAKGLLTEAELGQAVSKQILSNMRPMFTLNAVHSEFVEGESPLSGLPTCELSTADVIMDGISHLPEEELKSGESYLRSLDGCLRVNTDPQLRFQKTRLDSARGLLLSMVDGNTSIDDLLSLTPLPDDETMVFIYAALRAGLIERPQLDLGEAYDAMPSHTGSKESEGSDVPPVVNGGSETELMEVGVKTELERYESLDHYAFLRVRRDVSQEELEDTLARLALRFAPDQGQTPSHKEGLVLLSAKVAKIGETLGSVDGRASYDADLPPEPPPRVRRPDELDVDQEESVEIVKSETTSDPTATGAEPAEHAVVLHKHGLNALKRGGVLEAVDCLTKATEMDPMKVLYHFDLGRALSMNPKWLHRAEQAFLRVTELEPWNVEALAGLAKCYTRAKLKKKAKDAWQLVLDNDSENEEALRGLVNLNKKESTGMLKRIMNIEIGSSSKKEKD